jgi:hypothetical protein
LEVVRQLERYQQLAVQASTRSVLDYLQFVTINSRPQPRPFRLLAEPWQWAKARTLAPAFESISGLTLEQGREAYAGPRRFWIEEPRGHDKSTGVGRLANWLLAFAPRKHLRIQVAAADKGQAKLISDYMRTEIELNPFLKARIKWSQFLIQSLVNFGTLEILAADAAGSFGGTVDLLLVDELCHWPKSDLWDVLYSGMEKVPGSVTVVTTNSGIKGTWQDRILKVFKRSPTWLVYQAQGPLASWMNPAAVKELEAGMPRGLALRVLYNKWIDPGEENGLCTRAEAERCARLGAELGLKRRPVGVEGNEYVASVDYGLVKDRTVLCVMHMDAQGRYLVDQMDVWQGAPGSPVQADDVQTWCETAWKKFRCHFVMDPYQLEPVIQRLGHLPVERYEYRGGKTNYQALSNLLTLIRNGLLAWYPGCGDIKDPDSLAGVHTLADEFAEVITKPMGYGYRIDHESGRHDDRVVAVSMAALKLSEVGPKATTEGLERYF